MAIKSIDHSQHAAVHNGTTLPFLPPSTTLLNGDTAYFDCQLELAEVTADIAWLQWLSIIEPINHGQHPVVHTNATLPFIPSSTTLLQHSAATEPLTAIALDPMQPSKMMEPTCGQ